MLITDIVSYAEVRTAIGMSADELSDAELSLDLYAASLEESLRGLVLPAIPGVDSDTAPNMYIAVKGIPEAIRTPLQQQFFNLTKLFSAYSVAVEVAVSLSMKAPKSITDSKAAITRFSSEATFLTVLKELKSKVADLRTKLEGMISGESYDVSPLLTVVKRGVDPITGT